MHLKLLMDFLLLSPFHKHLECIKIAGVSHFTFTFPYVVCTKQSRDGCAVILSSDLWPPGLVSHVKELLK